LKTARAEKATDGEIDPWMIAYTESEMAARKTGLTLQPQSALIT
jgi:hypothetical protein